MQGSFLHWCALMWMVGVRVAGCGFDGIVISEDHFVIPFCAANFCLNWVTNMLQFLVWVTIIHSIWRASTWSKKISFFPLQGL